MKKFAGFLFLGGGVGLFFAGLLHPHGQPGQDFHTVVSSMISNPMWETTHKIALVSAMMIVCSLSLLAGEAGSRAGLACVRLGISATLFIAIDFAVEVAARTDAARYANGEPSAIIALVDALQTVGWPVFAASFIGLAVSTRLTPLWLSVVGMIGAAALGVGGLVVQGFHVAALAPVFIAGDLLPIWMVGAGVQLMRGTPL